ncbi:Transient receptor potential cation channel subfamily V member 6 [Nymphon striatum]|nr:Transient receptor potential cation channel subfamily V member 6 [Nymphon striatum]
MIPCFLTGESIVKDVDVELFKPPTVVYSCSGMSALHLCIAYNEIGLMKKLIDCGADINQRATGVFFRPTDQHHNPKKISSYEGLCYMGEYPLAWAASCGNEAAYNYLIDKGADPNIKDSYGNSVLHMIVINDKQEMYGFALRHPKKTANQNTVNDVGLTPLTMACKLGRNEIFREMLELSSLEFWRYSNITCAGYPLNALDSILPNGKINWNSALMIILSGQKEQHLDMLNGGVIQRLLEEKWKTFARTQFIKRLGVLIIHLLMLTIAICLRPAYHQPLIGSTDAQSIVRYCAEIVACLGCFHYVLFQQGSEIFAQGIVGFLFNLTSSPPKTIFLISNLLLLSCIPIRAVGNRMVEDTLVALVLPSSWFFLMFFAGAIRLTGPFVTIIYQMLTGDMLRFGIILSIFLLGFSQAFYFLYKDFPKKHRMYNSYVDTWMALLHMMLGEYDFSDIDKTFYSPLTKIVFVLFMILMPILLINMLIAMMGNTYLQVITRSEKEWMKQWASIVLNLERSLNKKMAQFYMHTYSIKLSTNDESDPEMEQRAVMVIKRKSKSKAKQRKGAFYNWKRIGKKVIEELKKRGGTAENFYLMQNTKKISISSATRIPSRCSNCSDANEDFAPPESEFIDKFTTTLDQLAWANDLSLQLSKNPKGFDQPNAATTNGFIPSDNIHPGQYVRQRSFSDTKGAVQGYLVDKSELTSSKNAGSSYKSSDSLQSELNTAPVKPKRKRRKKFLKRRNKVGVIHTQLVSGCVNSVANSLEPQLYEPKTPTDKGSRQEEIQREVPSTSGVSFKSSNENIPVNPKLKLPPVSKKMKEDDGEVEHMTNWSSKHVIPMIEICKWDNENSET